jgi:putative phage-type endonuclease
MKYEFKVISDEELPQGSEEWLNYRKRKIGASMAPAIMGKSPWKTRLQQWNEIILETPIESNEHMERGKRLEPEARNFLNAMYGVELRPVVIEHPVYKWHFSSLDGLYQREDGSIFAVEIKCPGGKDHSTAMDGQIPEKYIPQLNHQLEDLRGVDEILYFSYHPHSTAKIWHKRNKDSLLDQLKNEIDFYNSLIDFRSPEPCDKDTVMICDPEASNEAQMLIELMHLQSDTEEKIEICRQRLKKLAEHPRSKIGKLTINRFLRQGNVDYDAIPELKNINRNAYRKKPIESWRFTEN